MRDNDITKLPKWAQNEITRLESDVQHFKSALRKTEDGETDTRIQHWEEPTQYLPDGARVQFKTRGGREWVTVYADKDGRIVAMAAGSGTLAVLPRSANVVELRWES